MPNWRRVKKLYNHLETVKPSHFNMGNWFEIVDGTREVIAAAYDKGIALKQVIANGPACKTAGCLAFAVVESMETNKNFKLKEGSWNISSRAASILGLNNKERSHMFMGHWAPDDLKYDMGGGEIEVELSSITKRMALRYLAKAIKEKDLMVTL